MSDFLSIRNYPAFRRYFDAVHPFFWPVLYWQLKRAWIFLQRKKLTSVLLAVSWWGGVKIVYCGDKLPDPATYRPRPRTFRLLTDDCWASGLPACLEFLTSAAQRALILPCEAGEVAFATTPDTS